MLVDDVQIPRPAAVYGLVILVVDRPDVVLMLGFEPLRISVRGAGPAPLGCFLGYFQAFLSPDEAPQVFCRSYAGCGSRLRVA